MTDSPHNDLVTPPLLEQLGALCSLLIHDLANHLCIISGSATFAQMVADEPERVAHSIKAIIEASETASHALGSCGELRRALPETVPSAQVEEVLVRLRTWVSQEPGWTLNAEAGLGGTVRLPAVWVCFALQCLLKEIRVAGGTIRVSRVRQPSAFYEDSSSTTVQESGPFVLQIAMVYSGDQPLQFKTIRSRYDHLGLLAAFELNRCLGGRLESRTLYPGQQEVWLELPLISNDS
jgi:hypothetical protein